MQAQPLLRQQLFSVCNICGSNFGLGLEQQMKSIVANELFGRVKTNEIIVAMPPKPGLKILAPCLCIQKVIRTRNSMNAWIAVVLSLLHLLLETVRKNFNVPSVVHGPSGNQNSIIKARNIKKTGMHSHRSKKTFIAAAALAVAAAAKAGFVHVHLA